MKKIALTIIGSLMGFGAFAQTEPISSAASDSTDIVFIAVIAIMVIVLLVLTYMLFALNMFLQSAKSSGDIADVVDILKLTDAVPIEREHEILLDHDYDGIKELDNRLPPWWVYMFYGTIVFAFVYMWYYHMYGTGNIQEEEYQAEMVQAEVEMKLAASRMDESSVVLLTDEARIKNGNDLYQANCSACHGKFGEGGVGPNLTDENWIHGGDIKDVFKTVKYGVAGKGMIAWQDQLGPSQIQEVSSYIISLKGTNPANAKAPQGEIIVK